MQSHRSGVGSAQRADARMDGTIPEIDRELQVLERIEFGGDRVRQRDIASLAGLSLGMTNAILKRLARKGWLKVRKINSRNLQYVVSPRGMEMIARRSYRYVRRTIADVVRCRERLSALAAEARKDGYAEIVLVGASDLDFLVEHACGRHELRYRAAPADWRPPAAGVGRAYLLFPESFEPSASPEEKRGQAYLRELLLQ